MKTYKDFGIDIPYNRKSGNVKVFCPQCRDRRHNKTDKSLSVDLDKGVWNCHYCGFAGGINERNYNADALKYQRKEYKKPESTGFPVFSEKVVAWFARRGISLPTLTKAGVTEGDEWMPQKEAKVPTIQFNYFKDGELVNIKFRTEDKCFKLVPGAELLPYNLDAIKGEKECVICEGEADALSFIEIGYNNVVSVPNGANTNLTYLDDYWDDYFEDKETVYIASDSDTKGVLLREELLRRFGPERCRIIEYGEGCKDANEHLVMYGKDSLIECVKNAPEPKIEGIFTTSDIEDSLDAIYESGLKRGYTIGVEGVDKLCSFETKRLCVLTGVPSSGKSTFLNYIAERLNLRYNWKFAFFSPESAPISYHGSTLIELLTGKKFSKQTLPYNEYLQAKQHLQKNFFFIYPKDDFRLDAILEKAKILVRKKGIKALVIDPFNRLENEQGSKVSETQYISQVLDRLTNFAQQNDVLVFLMAHPTKMPKNVEGEFEVPTLYNISGSANFYNKADFGITVHRNKSGGWTEIHIQKVKFRHLGEQGMVKLKYNLNNGRYCEYFEGVPPNYDNTNHLILKAVDDALEAEKEAVFEFDSDFDNDLPF